MSACSLLVEYQLDADYRELFNSWSGPPWTEDSERQKVVDNDRMPTWAIDLYDICMYWEDDFFREETIRQRGPDTVKQWDGTGWGWILINKGLEFHILETGIRWTVQEDGIETESHSRTFIDAWQQPLDE
ncbi:hypothetical protein KAR02_04710 [Candidatus Bipolaricaulota bacterium]|nr:hypothetical protein [Candidatus Bipolaricaulota bacterium]